MTKKYQIILYGATGFTGKLCAEYLKINYSDLVWAIAGRNEQKLKDLKNELGLECDIFIASAEDKVSLDNITSQTEVVYLLRDHLQDTVIYLLNLALKIRLITPI